MQFEKKISIESKTISMSSPTFIIAEAGVNHNGDINLAKKLIDIAAEAKVDAIKFQTFKADELILKNVEKAPYQKNTTSSEESQYGMLRKLEITNQQNLELQQYTKAKGLIFLTTPFDEKSLDELDNLNLNAYKVASTDTTNLLFLKKVAQKNKPIFLSTGMSYLSEIKMALETIYEYNKKVVLLQCSANYPLQDYEANLRVLNTYKDSFDVLLGYSDHTQGIGAAPFAIPMGAKVIEKHFTLNQAQEGPDHKASLSPNDLKDFVKIVRKVDEYMGSSIKIPNLTETETRSSLQKCLVASCDIQKNEFFTENNIVAKRTGGIGISPIYYKEIINRKAHRDYKKDEIIEL